MRGEAEERGIAVSDREIDDELETDQGAAVRLREGVREVPRAVRLHARGGARERIELQLISRRDPGATCCPRSPSVTDAEIEAYYDANMAQFEQPETRDVRVILDQGPRRRPSEALDGARARTTRRRDWEKVAKEYSTDEATKSTGGLRRASSPGQSEPALDEQIFAAAEGELVGPFEGDAGFYVIQVEKVTPADDDRRSSEVAEQIAQTLVAARQQEIAQAFQDGLPGEVDRAHLLRRRLPDRPLRERRAAARPVHRGGRREPGLRRAGAVDAGRSQPGTQRRLRRSGRRSACRRARSAAAALPPGGCRPGSPRPAPGGAAPPGTAPPGTAPPGRRAAGTAPARRRRPPPAGRRRGGCADARCDALDRLDEITRRLRRECPWDREQDERSIVPHTVEEAYELADAARRGDDAKLLDELGDVLFQVVFLALLLEERGAGSLARGRRGHDRRS